MRLAVAALAVLLLEAAAFAEDVPAFTPEIGARLDTTLSFTDASSGQKPLALFLDNKPALLLLGYHKCPNLCGVALLDLADALAATGLAPDMYAVVFASIDPGETAADAEADRAKLASARPQSDFSDWRFLVGNNASVAALERSLGVSARRAPDESLYVHPVAVSTITADGHISRVFPGLDYSPRDLRLAIVEASRSALGTIVDHALLFCSGFDATTGRYTSQALLGVRVAGLAALAFLGGALLILERGRRAS